MTICWEKLLKRYPGDVLMVKNNVSLFNRILQCPRSICTKSGFLGYKPLQHSQLSSPLSLFQTLPQSPQTSQRKPFTYEPKKRSPPHPNVTALPSPPNSPKIPHTSPLTYSQIPQTAYIRMYLHNHLTSLCIKKLSAYPSRAYVT